MDYMKYIYLIHILLDFFAIVLVVYIYSIVKAFIAYGLGDKSYNITSRITLNPFKSLEPVGFCLLYFFNFGWAQPINISYLNIKDRTKAVQLFTIIPNVSLIVVSAILVLIGKAFQFEHILFWYFISKFTVLSFCYVLVNILPVYPFDGYTLLMVVGKPDLKMFLSNYEKIFQLIFIMALAFNFFGYTFYPLAGTLTNLLFGFIG